MKYECKHAGTLFWLLLIFVVAMSVWPKSPTGLILDGTNHLFRVRLDYLLHFFVYFVLVLLFILWKAHNISSMRGGIALLWVGAGLVFAVSNEMVQLFLPSRAFNPVDLIINVSGFVFGGIIGYFVIIRKKNKHEVY